MKPTTGDGGSSMTRSGKLPGRWLHARWTKSASRRYRYRYIQTRRWSLEEEDEAEDEEGALAYAGPIREAAPTVVGTDAVVAHCSTS